MIHRLKLAICIETQKKLYTVEVVLYVCIQCMLNDDRQHLASTIRTILCVEINQLTTGQRFS